MQTTEQINNIPLFEHSQVTFHSLNFRKEGDDIIVWVEGKGEFLSIPEIGRKSIQLLQRGFTIQETERKLTKQTGEEVDVHSFIKTLREMGFIASIDGVLIGKVGGNEKVSFPWIQRKHVRWLFSKYILSFFISLLVLTFIVLILHPSLIPSRNDFFWTKSTILIISTNVFLHFALVLSHELAHLLAARALGVGGRISFSTRLTSLIMQTDVTGIWAASRRKRMTVYLSGMLWNLLLMSIAILFLLFLPQPSLFVSLLRLSILLNFLSILSEFHLYMRTDLYFVLMDLLRCRNLFHDSLAYARYVISKIGRAIGFGKKQSENPLEKLPMHERKSVQLYSLLAVFGSVISLGVFAFYSVPIALRLYQQAVGLVVSGLRNRQALEIIDGTATLLVEVLFVGLYVYAFIRTHPAMRRFVGRILSSK